MPCYQPSTAPPGITLSGTSYATEADCLNACKEGACCEGTTCSVRPQCQCQGTGKTFKGVGTTCESTKGACCTGTSCAVVSECECVGTGKTFKGVGTTCTPNPCDPCACSDGSQYDFPVSAMLSLRNIAVASVITGSPPSQQLLDFINATQMPLTGLATPGATDVSYFAQPMCDCTGSFGSCRSPCPQSACWQGSQPVVTVVCDNRAPTLTSFHIRLFNECGSGGSMVVFLQDSTDTGSVRTVSTTNARTWCAGRPVVTQAVFSMDPSLAFVSDQLIGPRNSFWTSGEIVVDFVHNALP